MVIEYDVIIIGAGVAGATASSILASNNINTLLIEKEKLPRQKICGGFVSKRALSILEDSNIQIHKLETFKKCNSMQLGTFDLDSVENLANIEFGNVVAYLTDRDEFDYAIVRDAVSKGAKLKQNSPVKSIKKDNSNFIVQGDGFCVKSSYLLCADGVNGVSAKLLGFRDKWKKDEVCLCLESNITDYKPPTPPVIIYIRDLKWGYAWFFDKGSHASIGVGSSEVEASSLKQLFESFIGNCEYITSTKRLKINSWRIPTTGGIPGSFAKANAVLLGDAAGLVDPFLGEGIAYAIQSGKIAAECTINNKIDNYSKIINEEITSMLQYARILVKFITLDPKRFVRLLSNNKTILRDYAEVISGNSTYQEWVKTIIKN